MIVKYVTNFMFLLSSFYRDIANTGDIAGFPLGFRHQKSRLSRHFMVKKYIIFPNITLKRISFFQTNISKSWKTSEIWLDPQFIYQNMQNQTNSNCNELIKNQHNLTIQWFHGHNLAFHWDMAKLANMFIGDHSIMQQLLSSGFLLIIPITT